MSEFQTGDKVVVTNPMQPTRFKGGETATVAHTSFRSGMVQIRSDEDGVTASVHPQEITKQ
jgi:hypothetical protein